MNLPLGIGELDFLEWGKGLAAAFISGGSSAVVSGVAVSVNDPKDWGFEGGRIYQLMFKIFLFNGLMGMFLFLRNKSVPDYKTVKTTIQETGKPDKPPTTVVKTTEEVHIESK